MVAQHGDEPVVVGDRAGVEQVATLIGAGPADGIPILGGEHDGPVVIVAGCDDDQLAAVEVAVALEVMGVVPQQVVGGRPDQLGQELAGRGPAFDVGSNGTGGGPRRCCSW